MAYTALRGQPLTLPPLQPGTTNLVAYPKGGGDPVRLIGRVAAEANGTTLRTFAGDVTIYTDDCIMQGDRDPHFQVFNWPYMHSVFAYVLGPDGEVVYDFDTRCSD